MNKDPLALSTNEEIIRLKHENRLLRQEFEDLSLWIELQIKVLHDAVIKLRGNRCI